MFLLYEYVFQDDWIVTLNWVTFVASPFKEKCIGVNTISKEIWMYLDRAFNAAFLQLWINIISSRQFWHEVHLFVRFCSQINHHALRKLIPGHYELIYILLLSLTQIMCNAYAPCSLHFLYVLHLYFTGHHTAMHTMFVKKLYYVFINHTNALKLLSNTNIRKHTKSLYIYWDTKFIPYIPSVS